MGKKSYDVSGIPELDTKQKDHNDNTSEDCSAVESQKKNLKYPRSIPFIIGNEFCERFTYYGLRTILVLYLSQELGYSDDTSTVIYHVFSMLVYFLCIPGAIIADSWLGKFKTILSLSCVYVVGSVIISITAIKTLNLPRIELTMLGLVLIALGSGGIKPCVSAFGGDQFKLPEQAKQVAIFFSIFYFSINAGSLISTTVTPLLRQDVHCFGETSCYSLAFGVPAILMCLSIVIFVLGRPMYNVKAPSGNMLMLVSKTIGAAIAGRFREKKKNPREHWLDYADTKYDRGLIDDIKVLLRVLVLYIPLPLFWALFDQQGSRWTFQATRMDGTLGAIIIKPDQMQLINPLLILTFIPLYEAFFYPLLAKLGIRRPLQKLFCGGILAGVAFTISGIVELELEKTYPNLPNNNQGEIRIFNGFDCPFDITTNVPDMQNFNLKPFEVYEKKLIDLSKETDFKFISIKSSGANCPNIDNHDLKLKKGEAMSYLFKGSPTTLEIKSTIQSIEKPSKGVPTLQFYANINPSDKIFVKDPNQNNKVILELEYNDTGIYEEKAILASTYSIHVGDKSVKEKLELKQGGVYALLIGKTLTNDYGVEETIITTPNSLHMLWLVPQYVVMTLGEVMFSVTGLEFSYSQAPASMKSVLQACWLLTVSFGNVIVIIIAEAKFFDSQAFEFFLFAGLMFVDMLLFSFMAYRYKPNVLKSDSIEDATSPQDEPRQEQSSLAKNK